MPSPIFASLPIKGGSTRRQASLQLFLINRQNNISCIIICWIGVQSRGRNDKLVNTIEEDPDFLAFQKKLQEPVEKRPSAEVQLEAREKARAAEQEAEEAFVKKETAKLKALANRKEKGRGNSSRTERAIRLAVAANLANKESAKAIKVDSPLLTSLISIVLSHAVECAALEQPSSSVYEGKGRQEICGTEIAPERTSQEKTPQQWRQSVDQQ